MAYYGQSVTIYPKAARLTHDTAIFKMDPYVIIHLGGQQARTTPNWDGGRHPHWNDTFTLIRNGEESIRFVVYDRDSVHPDEFVGEGHFHFNRYAGSFFEEWIPLHYRGRQAGELHINVQMSGAPQAYPPQPAYPQPAYPQPGYPQPSYPQPGYAQPYPPQGYQQYPPQPYPSGPAYAPPPATIIVEERHSPHHGHHGHQRIEEVIVIPNQPYQGYQQTEVIVERDGHRHHEHHSHHTQAYVVPPQYPGQPYPPSFGQPVYRPPY